MKVLLAVVTASLIGSVAQSEERYPVLGCSVDSGYGYFSSYSMSPGKGDTTELDLTKLLHERSTISFATTRNDKPYVPAEEPFKVIWYDKLPDGRLESARFKADGLSAVILDLRSVGSPELRIIQAVIISESRNVTGTVFMTCKAKEIAG